jgi:hypothetical protein
MNFIFEAHTRQHASFAMFGELCLSVSLIIPGGDILFDMLREKAVGSQ